MKILITFLFLFQIHSILIKDSVIVDGYGRQRIYHGMNLVYKSAPYVPLTGEEGNKNPRLALQLTIKIEYFYSYSTETDAKLLQTLGQNVIRLGVMWPGVEPIQGQYNMTYIEEIRKIVNVCRDYDIFVVFEFHQDGFSEMFCGEGIPHWAAKNVRLGNVWGRFPWPVDGWTTEWDMGVHDNQQGIYSDHVIPTAEHCSQYGWGSYLTSYATQINYEWFYTNKHGLRDQFAEYFALLAKEFKGDETVIAFELLNEPSLTWSIYIYPGLTDSHYLQPFYDAVADRIHQVDPDRVIMFEPTTWSNEYPDYKITEEMFKSRLSHPPGGKQYANRSILAYHYYPWVNHVFNSTSADPYFKSRFTDYTKMEVAGFVTEWNLVGVSVQGDGASEEIDRVRNLMDEYQLSSMAWTYKGYLPTNEQTQFVPTCTGCGSGLIQEISDTQISINWQTAYSIARTYAQAVQGKIENMRFNSTSNDFFLTYRLDTDIMAPTEIYINTQLGEEVQPRYTLNNIKVDIQPNDIMEFHMKNDNIIIIRPIRTLIAKNIKVKVHISVL